MQHLLYKCTCNQTSFHLPSSKTFSFDVLETRTSLRLIAFINDDASDVDPAKILTVAEKYVDWCLPDIEEPYTGDTCTHGIQYPSPTSFVRAIQQQGGAAAMVHSLWRKVGIA